MIKIKSFSFFCISFMWIFLLTIISTLIRFQNIIVDVPIAFILFTIVTQFQLKQKQILGRFAFVFYTLIFLFINITASLIDHVFPWVGLPNIIASILGIGCGCLIRSTKVSKYIKLIYIFSMISITMFYVYKGNLYWFNYITYDNFTGHVKKQILDKWHVYDKNGDVLKSNIYKDKIVLLDFWSSSCYICFEKFPLLEQLYQKYKKNPTLIIQAVNIPLKQDSLYNPFDKLNKKGYSFPKLIGDSNTVKAFDVKCFPTCIIIQNNYVIFKGDLLLSQKVIEKLLQ